MKNKQACILTLILVSSIIFVASATINSNRDKRIEKEFITTGINKVESKKVQFRTIQITKDFNDRISDAYEYDDIIFIDNNKALVFKDNDKSTEVLYAEEKQVDNIIFTPNIYDTIDIYEEKEIPQILNSIEIKPEELGRYLWVDINDASEVKYKDEVLKAIQGDKEQVKRHFESDVLTNKIEDYIQTKLDRLDSIKVYTGISNENSSYIDRVCILGWSYKDGTEINLKVILKLNKQQKIYDLDIY